MMIETSFMGTWPVSYYDNKKPLDFVVLPSFQGGYATVPDTGFTGNQWTKAGTSCDPRCQNISLTPTRFAPPDKSEDQLP
jgi:hypothetical protein